MLRISKYNQSNQDENRSEIKYLQINNVKKYKKDLISILKKLRIEHEIAISNSSQSNRKAEYLNRIFE